VRHRGAEIATYTALERLAKAVGDDETAKLAASIRADEERMLARILREIPKLTDAVTGAEVKDDPSYDIAETGAAEAVREVGKAAKRTARTVPGVTQAEGQIKGAVASGPDLAIARYDSLTSEEITGRLGQLSPIDLAKVDASPSVVHAGYPPAPRSGSRSPPSAGARGSYGHRGALPRHVRHPRQPDRDASSRRATTPCPISLLTSSRTSAHRGVGV
jgi:hypothetical protein